MKEKYIVWKNLGETPLEALNRLAEELSIPKDVPLTYAGRLDPTAEGFLIILVGDECKKKSKYTDLNKTYMAEILVGVSTDSFDLLGVPTYRENVKPKSLTALAKDVETYLDTCVGKFNQTYPPYSSKTVDGKQLHEHAREGNEIELPTHEVELISYEDVTTEDFLSEDVLTRVGELTTAVTGDFRQAEIVQAWAELNLPEKMQLISITLKVGSGFYVRQLAEDLGRHLGTGACLYSLVRTEIGEYKHADF